jgi:hypothetical protein
MAFGSREGGRLGSASQLIREYDNRRPAGFCRDQGGAFSLTEKMLSRHSALVKWRQDLAAGIECLTLTSEQYTGRGFKHVPTEGEGIRTRTGLGSRGAGESRFLYSLGTSVYVKMTGHIGG